VDPVEEASMESQSKFWQGAGRILKGIVLMVFIGVLAEVALEALQGTFSERLLNLRTRQTATIGPGVADSCETPNGVFTRWQRTNRGTNAAGLTLDAVWPGWRSRQNDTTCEPSIWQADWFATFSHIDGALYRMILDPSFDVKAQDVTDLILPEPKKTDASFNGRLPLPVQQWVLSERSKRTLTDIVVLLVVIGMLGSLIYLIVGFISPEDVPSMRDLIFRPILGAFLAIGVFVANVGVLGVTSTGGLWEIRPESLYLLALGAGLFTDRVYEYLRSRVVDTLTDRRRVEVVEENRVHVTDLKVATRSSETRMREKGAEEPRSIVPVTSA
jgi:hypothetical protein